MEIRNCDDLPTYLRTDRQTWVGARDACASKNNWGHLSLTFHVEQPETLIEWKFESITDGHLKWVGARDACASKNIWGPLSSTFHVKQPETLIEWKFKSITYLPTDGRTDGRTDMGRC